MKRIIIFCILFTFFFCIIALALWNRRVYPLALGVSFSHRHATWLGLEWKTVYEDMLRELQPAYTRIAAPWDEVEAQPGTFDFSAIDWQMDKANEYGTKVTLVVGQKAPRWPECHVPEWLTDYTEAEAKEYLLRYVRQTVERYKNHPALEWWQVENEPFIRFHFGDCVAYRQEWIHDEIALVRSLDPGRPILVTDSGELGVWYGASRSGDFFGTTLYRVVRNTRGKIIRYDWLPPVLYKLKAIVLGGGLKHFVIAELQAEPWFTDVSPMETPIVEQEKTLDPGRLQAHIEYARHTGASRAYLWGVEWWYWMKEKHYDARYWETVKDEMKKVS